VLTKSKYLHFRRCPNEYWLRHNSPELFDSEITVQDTHLREQGYAVQKLVRQMGIFKLDPAFYTVEFERKFRTSDLYSEADVTVTNEQTGDMAIYEIKSSSKVKQEHLVDLAFQKAVAISLGLSVSKTCLITVNSDYVKNGELSPDELFTLTDVSGRVDELKIETADGIDQALEYLYSKPIPKLLDYCGDKLDCRFFQKHFPDMPNYNVFHVSRLGEKKLKELLTDEILDIRHIPADFALTGIQRKQVDAACSGEPFIDKDAIKAELARLEYPLHFLDYESFSYALPIFSGSRPYQQLVFQYSLHTIKEQGAECRHSAWLSRNDRNHPSLEIAQKLSEAMSECIGSVLVWHAQFERDRNEELASMFPEYAGLFDEINAKMFDLKTIFSNQHYVHPDFLGSASIKDVMPVLVPEHSYEALTIGDGTTAAIRWFHMATGRVDKDEARNIYEDLLKYCRLDTLAMVEIYEHLNNL